MKLVQKNLYQCLLEAAEESPDAEGYIFPAEKKRFTYRKMLEYANNISRALLAHHVGRGTHISIWGVNTSTYVALIFACARIGTVVSPLNINSDISDMLDLVEHNDSELLFITSEYRGYEYDQMLSAFVRNGAKKSGRLPRLRHIFLLNENRGKETFFPPWECFMAGLARVDEEEAQKAQAVVNCGDILFLQYTSGTSGSAKGVLLSHFSAVNIGIQFGAAVLATPGEKTCSPLPLFHCFGNIDVLISCLIYRSPLVMLDYFSAVKLMTVLEKERCPILYAVPTMYVAMYQHPDFDQYDFSYLQKGATGGSVCLPNVMEKIEEKFGMSGLLVGYGATETCALATISTIHDDRSKRLFTCGNLISHMQAKIISPETSQTVAAGQPGELLLKGFNLMHGYYKREDLVRQVIDEDGWYHTGDMATMDENGVYHIVGRYKDIIVRGGENIVPSDIEMHLLQLPGLKGVEVVGVPDEKYTEEIAAFVIFQENTALRVDDILDYARRKLPFYMLPKYIFVVESFPVTPSGKTQKHKLVDRAKRLLSLS